LNAVAGIVSGLCYAIVFIAMCAKLVYLRGPERVSMTWVVAGYAVCVGSNQALLGLVNFAVPDWMDYPLLFTSAAFPLSVAYAVVRHRAFALGFVANRVLVYGFFGAAIGVLFAALDWILSTKLALTSLWIGIDLAAALGLGMVLQAQHNRAVRTIDRFFLPQRHAVAVSLDRIRDAMQSELREPDENLASDVAGALDLTSVAFFRRVRDGGFVRQSACGWPDGSAWHVLPSDTLCRTLNDSKIVTLLHVETLEFAVPGAAARPALAIALRRRGLVEGAVLVGPRTTGAVLDDDEARGVAEIFGTLVAT
jgi:hypothetical protein